MTETALAQMKRIEKLVSVGDMPILKRECRLLQEILGRSPGLPFFAQAFEVLETATSLLQTNEALWQVSPFLVGQLVLANARKGLKRFGVILDTSPANQDITSTIRRRRSEQSRIPVDYLIKYQDQDQQEWLSPGRINGYYTLPRQTYLLGLVESTFFVALKRRLDDEWTTVLVEKDLARARAYVLAPEQ